MRRFYRLFLPALFLFSCQKNDEGILLTFKYQPGQQYRYLMTDEVEKEIAIAGEDTVTIGRSAEQSLLIHVIEQDSATGYYTLEVEMIVVADSIYYPEDYPQDKRKKNAVGKRSIYRLVMDKAGELHDVRGENERRRIYYEENYKHNRPVFPRRKISPGYEWKKNVFIDIGEEEPLCAKTTYRFEGFETVQDIRCAVISFSSVLEYDWDLTDTPYNTRGHQSWKYHNKSTSEGTIYFSPELGIMVHKKNLLTFNSRSDIIDKDGKRLQKASQTVDIETTRLIRETDELSEQ